MKAALVAVAMMFATPALAETMWFDIGCWQGLVSEGDALISEGEKLRYYFDNGTTYVECSVTGTTLTCADGKVREMVVLPDARGVMLNGVHLYVVGDENPGIYHD